MSSPAAPAKRNSSGVEFAPPAASKSSPTAATNNAKGKSPRVVIRADPSQLLKQVVTQLQLAAQHGDRWLLYAFPSLNAMMNSLEASHKSNHLIFVIIPLLLISTLLNESNFAKIVAARIPAELYTVPDLALTFGLVNAYNNNDFMSVCALCQKLNRALQISPVEENLRAYWKNVNLILLQQIQDYFRGRMTRTIETAYSQISLDQFSQMLGFSREQSHDYIKRLNWAYQSDTETVIPRLI